MYESGGRPTKLDKERQDFIRHFVENDNTWNKSDIHAMVRREFIKALHRQYPRCIPETVCKKVSVSTLRRWTARFIEKQRTNVVV